MTRSLVSRTKLLGAVDPDQVIYLFLI